MIYAGYSKSERLARAEEVLNQVNLSDRMDHHPNQLSGGQRQRVAVARALVNKPSIILADEPTGNLDSKTSIEIMNLFNDIHANGNTVILVTHEEEIAAYAHRVIRLRDGLIESDTRTQPQTRL
jgi:putative ABC transport system ATP-binding protein